MRTLYSLYDKMEEELKQLCKKDPMSVEDVELIYKIIDILKDVTTIEAMKKAEMEDMSMEYSNAYSRHSKEEMINNLKSMMENARTPEERENYRATIEQMSR